MQIQINPGDITATPPIEERIQQDVDHAMRYHREQVTRVEVHLHDENGPKAGKDMRVVMEARLAGHQPLTVDCTAVDLYTAIKEAANKLERAVKSHLERHETQLRDGG